ncbi:MAG: hypothetical protein IJY50_00385 [Clostridia bacterium]|nr:hypothetical protein [Clostridia bacterium]
MRSFLEQGTLITGINYWASDNAIRMWEDFHPDVIEADFQKLAAAGVTVLRVFPLWSVFQPLTAAYSNNGLHEYQFGERPLPDTEAGRAGVSEEACQRFSVFCDLAEKHGLQLLVGLITGHMSFRYFAPAPFQHRNPITDPTLIKWELRFVKYFVKRFKDKPAIAAWDLGNELEGFASRPDSDVPDAGYVWMSAITNAVKSVDTAHPVVSGYGSNTMVDGLFPHAEVGEVVDINTVHPYNVFQSKEDPLPTMRPILDGVFRCKLSNGMAGVPTFIQEVGSIGYLTCSERTEADFYRALLYAAWSHDCGGVMWWCAFDQGMQEYAPYDWNNIGSDYGFFRADGSAKPIVAENLAFHRFVKSLPFDRLPPQITNAVCIVSRTKKNESRNMLRATYCLAKQANLDLEFIYFDQPLPESDLYLIPGVDHNHGISRHRLMAVLERVKAGATLYISLGQGLFRMAPMLTGCHFASREKGVSETVSLGDTLLRITGDYKYNVEDAGGAEVLATGQDGRPVYVRHAYGKGSIYFATVSPEKSLNADAYAFRRSDGANFAQWYRVFADTAPTKKVLDTDHPLIRGTEHVAQDGTRYGVLINYAEEPQDCRLRLADGWCVTQSFGGQLCGDHLSLDACAAMVLEMKRK